MNIGICKNTECLRKDNCKRYIEQVGEEFNFKAICSEENNYQWLWKTETTIAEPTESKDTIETQNT